MTSGPHELLKSLCKLRWCRRWFKVLKVYFFTSWFGWQKVTTRTKGAQRNVHSVQRCKWKERRRKLTWIAPQETLMLDAGWRWGWTCVLLLHQQKWAKKRTNFLLFPLHFSLLQLNVLTETRASTQLSKENCHAWWSTFSLSLSLSHWWLHCHAPLQSCPKELLCLAQEHMWYNSLYFVYGLVWLRGVNKTKARRERVRERCHQWWIEAKFVRWLCVKL